MYYRKIVREMNNAGEFNGGFKSLTGAALAFSLSNMYLGNSTGAGFFGIAAFSFGIASLVVNEEKKFGKSVLPRNLSLEKLSEEMLKNSGRAGMYGVLGGLTAGQSLMVMSDGDLVRGIAGLMAGISCSAMYFRQKLNSVKIESTLTFILNNMKREEED